MQPEAFVLINGDIQVLRESSSGGAFSLLSDSVLKINGYVFGAVYDYRENDVKHKGTNSFKNRNEMRGSKYIQSKMGDSFSIIGQLLKQKKTVLFTGTICQVVGLKEYLNAKKIDMDTLYTCDIICHGVGSPRIW